jgi:protoporphyrinogen oxidase
MKKKVVIVGAGIAGLSFAYESLLKGFEILLVEKEKTVGGLSKSFTHNDCQLDIGVHILHGRDEQVLTKVREIVHPDEWVKVKRNGKLFLKGRYIDWPLNLKALYQLQFSLGIKILLDQIIKKKSNSSNSSNFHDELLQIYGPTLYYSFFHPITEKFLNTDPKNIHSDWAFSSIRAATKIEDKSFVESNKYLTDSTDDEAKNEFNILKFLIKSITASRNNEPFYYFKNGYGTLTESYKEKILQLGGNIKLDSTVDSFIFDNKQIKYTVINGDKYDSDHVVWTGNLPNLISLLDIEDPNFSYLHSKFLYFFLKKCNKNHQVCYYADNDISFVRGTILSNHSKTIINNPNISDLLCLDYSYNSINEMFTDSEIKKNAIKDIIKVGLIKDESSIDSIFELNVPYTYPLLTLDYKDKLFTLQNQLKDFGNLVTLGRQGSFGYENADVIIKEVINHPMFK